MLRPLIMLVTLGCAVVTTGCGRITRDVRLVPDPAATLDELWQEPSDIARRNLYYGSGGADSMPRETTFTFVARDTGGWSPGFDDYHGIYRDVIRTVTLADLEWACGLLSRISDGQWNDAFRAGGYNPEETRRYVAKIKAKIAQGLQVAAGRSFHANPRR